VFAAVALLLFLLLVTFELNKAGSG